MKLVENCPIDDTSSDIFSLLRYYRMDIKHYTDLGETPPNYLLIKEAKMDEWLIKAGYLV